MQDRIMTKPEYPFFVSHILPEQGYQFIRLYLSLDGEIIGKSFLQVPARVSIKIILATPYTG